MERDLTRGSITKMLLVFAAPMILGNLLQQCYTIADTFIVGKYIGVDALAAVGSTYTLMTFLTSILIGLCMGSGAICSACRGGGQEQRLRETASASFLINGSIAVLLNGAALLLMDWILKVLNTPLDVWDMTRDYVQIMLYGLVFIYLYNYFAFYLRALGNSVLPLCFLGVASVANILLDLLFVVVFQWGIRGAAFATVLSQAGAGLGLAVCTWVKKPELSPGRQMVHAVRAVFQRGGVQELLRQSLSASAQQSVMNFGILMIQGLVNSFGTAVMAAFTAAVKIDSFAYMPAQEFGNAFSLYISQNYGANNRERIQQGTKRAMQISMLFCAVVSVLVFVMAPALMQIFIAPEELEIIEIGVTYLRIEGACYCGIGVLFLLYGYYRGIGKPGMSLILTVISLGTRVVLAYLLAPVPAIGVLGIWTAIPIGWLLADVVGLAYRRRSLRLLQSAGRCER